MIDTIRIRIYGICDHLIDQHEDESNHDDHE